MRDFIAVSTQRIFTRRFDSRRRRLADRLICRYLGPLFDDRRRRSRFRLPFDKSISLLTSYLIRRLILLLLLPKQERYTERQDSEKQSKRGDRNRPQGIV